MWKGSGIGVGVSTATPVHQPVNRPFESKAVQVQQGTQHMLPQSMLLSSVPTSYILHNNNNNNNNNQNLIGQNTLCGNLIRADLDMKNNNNSNINNNNNNNMNIDINGNLIGYLSNIDYNELQLQHQQQLQLQHQHYQDSLPQQYDLHFSQFMAAQLPLSLPLVTPMMQQNTVLQPKQSLSYVDPVSQSPSMYYQSQNQDLQQLQQQQQQQMNSQQPLSAIISSDTNSSHPNSSHNNSPSAPPGITLSGNVLPILPYVLPPAVIGRVVDIGSGTIFNSSSGSGSTGNNV